MVALLEAMRSGEVPARAGIVVSNEPDAPGLEKARSYGVATAVVSHREFRGQGREAHEQAVAALLDAAGVEVVCLAGYMRILSPWFVGRYPGRVLNIHPALLPACRGLHGQAQALEAGMRISGCTVHIVDAEVDHGPILAQAAVPVLPGDTEETLGARILEQEHRLYPLALRLVCEDRVRLEGMRSVVENELVDAPASLVVPDPAS
ncbi:MAG: phosphoribosylglycinamide formyltransferase [Acidobacteria bacterium]|nr:phosphoribosylglycinamide formyltransferase [Acidobacteriota bacterium]